MHTRFIKANALQFNVLCSVLFCSVTALKYTSTRQCFTYDCTNVSYICRNQVLILYIHSGVMSKKGLRPRSLVSEHFLQFN